MYPDYIKQFFGKFRSFGSKLLDTKWTSYRYPEWAEITLVGFYQGGIFFLDGNNSLTKMKQYRFRREFKRLN
jgi:hypothetical protein